MSKTVKQIIKDFCTVDYNKAIDFNSNLDQVVKDIASVLMEGSPEDIKYEDFRNGKTDFGRYDGTNDCNELWRTHINKKLEVSNE